MRAPCDLPAYLPEPAHDMPGYQARDRLADDFECFLEEQFSACTPQQTATCFPETSTSAMEEQSTLAKPCGRAQSAKSREQRRKTHNRAAQKQWREKQKVGLAMPGYSGLRDLKTMTHVMRLSHNGLMYVVQTRAEELESQVEAATAQLKALEDSQRQLEARNALLEIANPSFCGEQTQHIYSLVSFATVIECQALLSSPFKAHACHKLMVCLVDHCPKGQKLLYSSCRFATRTYSCVRVAPACML